LHLRHQGVQMLIMATQQENAYVFFFFFAFSKLGSATALERSFRARYKKPPPCRTNIYHWYKRMEQEGCFSTGMNTWRPRVFEEAVNRFRVTFQRSPRKSARRGSCEQGLPQATVWRIRRRIEMSPYRLHLLQNYESCRK